MLCVIFSEADVFSKFKEFEATATNESGQRIGTLRTDNGGEYMSSKSKGINYNIAYTPEQNGTAERINVVELKVNHNFTMNSVYIDHHNK